MYHLFSVRDRSVASYKRKTSQSALNCSLHFIYALIISVLTLGFLILKISLKSLTVMGLGFACTSMAFPLSNNSFTTLSWADWQISLMSLALSPSETLASSSFFKLFSFFNGAVY